jgi:hypothetical protein
LCYLLYLKRDPDPPGYNIWLDFLNRTNDYNAVIAGFTESEEYLNRFVQ